MSTRMQAERLGVDHKTVINDRGCSGGEHSPPEQPAPEPLHVEGQDGKRYPARQSGQQEATS